MERLRAVVLELFVALESFLRGKEACTGAERVRAASEAEGIGADGNSNVAAWIENVGAKHGIANAVAEFHVASTEAMRENCLW